MATETIRPSKAAYRNAIGANAVILLPLLALSIFRLREGGAAGYILLLVVLAVIGIGVLLYFRNTRIDFGDGTISRTTMFGTTKSWAISDIGTVLNVRSLTAFMAPMTDNTFVLDTAGHLIVRATDQRWAPQQVRALVEATGEKPVVLKEPTDALAVRAKYPHAIAWWEAHPFKVAFIAVGAFMVLFFVGYALYTSDLRWMIPQFFRQLAFRLGLS